MPTEHDLPSHWGHWLDKRGNHWWIFGRPGKFMAQCLDPETGMPDDETPNLRLQELTGDMRGDWIPWHPAAQAVEREEVERLQADMDLLIQAHEKDIAAIAADRDGMKAERDAIYKLATWPLDKVHDAITVVAPLREGAESKARDCRFIDVLNRLYSMAFLKEKADKHLADINRICNVADKHGWNGIENSKALWDFFEDQLSERDALEAANAALQARLAPLETLCEDFRDLGRQLLKHLSPPPHGDCTGMGDKDTRLQWLSDLRPMWLALATLVQDADELEAALAAKEQA
jgi:hypothetical protein